MKALFWINGPIEFYDAEGRFDFPADGYRFNDHYTPFWGQWRRKSARTCSSNSTRLQKSAGSSIVIQGMFDMAPEVGHPQRRRRRDQALALEVLAENGAEVCRIRHRSGET